MNLRSKGQHWVLPKSGTVDVFRLEPKELPKLGEHQVRLKVHFSGLNFADIFMRQGLYPDAPAFPFTPGYEVSGVVEAVGRDVRDIVPGDQVCAGTVFGGYSSHVIVEQWQLMKFPFQLGPDEAAGIPVSALTAYNALFELARVRRGDKILIDCATGALGQFCVHLLKDFNVEIVGLTSSQSKKNELLKQGLKGMTHAEFEASHEADFQVAINSLGGRWIKLHYERLAPTGRIVCLGAADAVMPGKRNLFKALKTIINFPKFKPIDLMNDNKGVMGLNLLRLMDRPELLKAQLKALEQMELHPQIDRIFSYRHLPMAQIYIESRQSRGKVLLDWRF